MTSPNTRLPIRELNKIIMLKNFGDQVEGLKNIATLYAPVYMYILLKMYGSRNNTNIHEEIDVNIKNICGKNVAEWPESERQEFINLFINN